MVRQQIAKQVSCMSLRWIEDEKKSASLHALKERLRKKLKQKKQKIKKNQKIKKTDDLK